MKFRFTKRIMPAGHFNLRHWDPHFKSAFDVYTFQGGNFLGTIYETDNNRGWVAGIKNRITHSVIFKRGFQTKQLAAERLYDEAVINSI